MTDLPVGTSKLIQYLNEAYGTERRLETALQAHLGLATRTAYKNRLRDHLSETKRHAREVSRRIRQLGGSAAPTDVPGPDALGEVAQIAVAGAQRAAALAQGPIHALRGTGKEEKQLKNAKTEYASEAEEIATYSAIMAVAQALGDGETATLARSILREEERMHSFLEKEIPRMAGAVVTAEVPRSERSSSRSRRRGSRAKTSRAKTARASSSRGKTPRGKASRSKASRIKAPRSKASRTKATRRKASPAKATARRSASSRSRGSARTGARRSSSRRAPAGVGA